MAKSSLPSPQPFDDHTSLTGSLGDFSDSDKQQSPLFGLPSQHSGFRSSSEPSECDHEAGTAREEEAESDDLPWSPPAWRQPTSAGGWYRHQPYSQDVERLKSQSASRSRGTSKGFESALGEDEDATLAAKIPLPKGSISPVRDSPYPVTTSPPKERSPSVRSPSPKVYESEDLGQAQEADVSAGAQNPNNCMYTLHLILYTTNDSKSSDSL